jgi:hypothetical protein
MWRRRAFPLADMCSRCASLIDWQVDRPIPGPPREPNWSVKQERWSSGDWLDHDPERNASIAWARRIPMLRMIKVPAKAEAMVHLLLNLAEDECVKTTASRPVNSKRLITYLQQPQRFAA